MGAPTPYTLARSSALADELFANAAPLADRLLDLLGDREWDLHLAYTARARQPAGPAVRVHAVNEHGEHELVGYAYLPLMGAWDHARHFTDRLALMLRGRQVARKMRWAA